jgi:hypothetical protein
MSQNDFTIANQSFPAFRADLNSALQALASNNSGTSAPSTTFANMWWYDSTNNIMYIRNEDNDAWIKFAELDQTNDKFVLSGTLQLDDGTVSAPALTFNSDTNMGIYRGGTDILKFVTAGTDAITIDASQNVGIGIATPTSKLQLLGGTSGLDQLSLSSNLTNNTIKFAGVIMTNYANTTTALLGAKAESGSTSIYYGSSGTDHRGPQNHIFYTNASSTATSGNIKRMDIDSGGDISFYEDTGTTPKFFWDSSAEALGIGTSSPSGKLNLATGASTACELRLTSNNTGSGAGDRGRIVVYSSRNDGTAYEAGKIEIDRSTGTTDEAHMLFATNGGSGNTERMRIASNGNVGVGKTSVLLADEGVNIFNDGRVYGTVDGDDVFVANRLSNDGNLIRFFQNTSEEGNISVSGTTISYNGGHLSRWSQLTTNTRDESIVKGTVMTNLDQMAEWTTDGVTEDNEQLNCMAVSSVEGDANVAGVFVNWDNDDDIYTNDMNIAMTGDMVVRIAQGTTVARGDLLMSAGDGTAKPQGDDIVRSKTIAKVTSANVSYTYDDGTYLVPCVLMAC